jgi:hypothetical protein
LLNEKLKASVPIPEIDNGEADDDQHSDCQPRCEHNPQVFFHGVIWIGLP